MLSLILAALSGVVYAFAFPNFLSAGFAPLSPLALLIMAWALEKIPSTKKRVFAVLLHQTGFNLTGFYWVPATLQEFGGLPPALSHLVALFLAPVLNPQWWGWLVWLHFRRRLPGVAQWNAGMRAFFGAVILTVVETLLPQQFPVFAGHVWMHYHEWLNLAPFGGVSTYSFFTWWLVLGLLPLTLRQLPSKSALVAFVMFVGAHFVVPGWTPAKEVQALNIRVVQANVGNFLKIESESGSQGAIDDVIRRYRDLTLKDNPTGLDLVIWPETAYPFTFTSALLRTGSESPDPLFRELIAQTGAEMLIGGYDQKADAGPWDRFETDYNAALHFDISGKFKEIYHKQIRIPFGETMPFGPLNRPISKVITATSFFAAGERTPTFTTRRGPKFVTPICYEILQSSFTAKLLNEAPTLPDFIVNLTNDSWYGATAEPYQHLFLAKWRALEFRRPIVRSTNTGITTVIYPNGVEGRRLLTGEKDVLDVRLEVPLKAEVTVYQQWGLLPLASLWLLLSVLFTAFWWWKIRPVKGRANVRLL